MTVDFRGNAVTAADVRRALAEFDKLYPTPNAYNNWLENGTYKYALQHQGRLYPPKYLLSQVTGSATDEFTGGPQTNRVFEELGFRIVALRNPPWARDELILALDLYVRSKPRILSDTDAPVIELSDFLRQLPIHAASQAMPSFRNPNGVAMKLGNFLGLDPEYRGVGLSAGSRLDRVIWDEFYGHEGRLRQVAEAIRRNALQLGQDLGKETEEYTEEVPEGRILLVTHLRRERNAGLVKKKKEQAKRKGGGRLVCEACSFDFATIYGPLGDGFAECHHVRPLSTLRPGEKTHLNDLAIVCANCHRMLHRGSVWTVEDLREVLAAGPYTAHSS